MNEAAFADRSSVMNGLFQSIQHKAGVCCSTDPLTDDVTGIDVKDKGNIDHILQSSSAERSLQSTIEAAGVNSKHAAHAADIELVVMPYYERISHSLPGSRCLYHRRG